MADKKITDLTLLTSADATDILPVVDVSTNSTKKTTVAGLASAVIANVPDSSIATAKLANNAVTAAKIETQQAWQAPTLTNSWVYFGTPYNTPGYMKDSLGFVHLKGMVKSGTSGQPIFTLPVGYRPAATVYTKAPNGGAVAEIGILLIAADGTVRNGTGSNAYQSLDDVSFRAEG